jgi:hypothetical protein
MDRPRFPLLHSFLFAMTLVLGPAAPGLAQSGTTLTPDRRTFLVNKDLGPERWTISAGLATDDVESVLSVTGNVFRSDGGPPSFVLCHIRDDSTGTLEDAASVFRLTCQGTDACPTNARECARDQWQPIADVVEIPASFFLPPNGLGSPAQAAATSRSNAVAAFLADAGTRVGRALGLAPEVPAQGADRGATLSLDRLTYLVNKDVGGQRWSIGLNFVPVDTPSGGATNELSSVTGNVFFPDGSAPSFVYCTEREDSTGTLEDAASEFRFRCSGGSACAGTAEECAATGWTAIADDVRLAASFFLPPGGLPPSVQSDPEIFVIGKTSDPPAIVTREFTIPGAELSRVSGVAGCPAGATCLADRLGSCTEVSGRAVEVEGFGCGCEIPDVPPECITCGGGASGACGATGGYPVGNTGRTARGVCLPFAAASEQCVVYAVGAGGTEDAVVESCGGPLGASCAGDRCCADDPRDGCTPADGGVGCAGVCVAAGGCDPATEQCGACFAAEPSPAVCGDGVVEGDEECDQDDLDGESCESLGLGEGELGCSTRCDFDTSGCAGATSCGNGERDPGEECDGSDLAGEDCASVTGGNRPDGMLSCSSDCTFDPSECGGSPEPPCLVGANCDCIETLGEILCVLAGAVGSACENPVSFTLMMTSDCDLSGSFTVPPGDSDGVSRSDCVNASDSSTFEAGAIDTVTGASVTLSGDCGPGIESAILE